MRFTRAPVAAPLRRDDLTGAVMLAIDAALDCRRDADRTGEEASYSRKDLLVQRPHKRSLRCRERGRGSEEVIATVASIAIRSLIAVLMVARLLRRATSGRLRVRPRLRDASRSLAVTNLALRDLPA